MSESDDEAWARSVVEQRLGVNLRFVDTDGRVDYLFTDVDGRSAAMEVTTLTDRKLKASTAAWLQRRGEDARVLTFESCWSVSVDERDTVFAGLREKLEQLLRVLELTDVEREIWWSPEELGVRHRGAGVAEVVGALSELGVQAVYRWAESCRSVVGGGAPHEHRLDISRLGGFHAVSSDDALSVIEEFVAGDGGNLAKLVASGAPSRHLFIRLDDETEGRVSRPFGVPSGPGWDHFGLPSRPPELPQEVTALWVVHETSGFGWHWDGQGWSQVTPAPLR